MATLFGYQDSMTGRVAPLAVRADGRVVQLPSAVLADWPIRYIMTFERQGDPFRAALAALFGAVR
jgi:hypothetical protein